MGVSLYYMNGKYEYETTSLYIGGYASFFKLRSLIAEVYDRQLGLNGQFADFYKSQTEGMGVNVPKDFWTKYNEKLNKIEKEWKLSSRVLDFLYQPDCDGRLTPDGCRMVWKIMSDDVACCCVFSTHKWYDLNYPKFGTDSEPCNWGDIANFFEKAWLERKTVYWG